MSRIESHPLPVSPGRSRRGTVVVVFVLLLLVAPGAWAEDEVPTNLDLMTDLTAQVVNELVERFSRELGGRGVRLQPYANNEQYQLMTNVFTAALTERGFATFQPGSVPSDSAAARYHFVLKYEATSFNLTYPKVYRSHLIGGKRVRRRADVSLLATLVSDASGSVVAVGDANREHEDQFDYSDIDRVEEGTAGFTRPPVPSSGWGKYAEPLLVTGIVVGLIYLFFSNQSDN